MSNTVERAERPKEGPGGKLVRITVVAKADKRSFHPELIKGSEEWLEPVCPAFEVGDAFIVDSENCPAGFCQGAFVDIFRYISGLRAGADYSWMKEPGTMITCCTDGFRPVVFKLERMNEQT